MDRRVVVHNERFATDGQHEAVEVEAGGELARLGQRVHRVPELPVSSRQWQPRRGECDRDVDRVLHGVLRAYPKRSAGSAARCKWQIKPLRAISSSEGCARVSTAPRTRVDYRQPIAKAFWKHRKSKMSHSPVPVLVSQSQA
jgi:hypothetical protein